MGKLFRNKYHIGSIRYKGYDYSLAGAYFVTICTENKIHYFGEIKEGKMIFSETGKIAQQMLTEIPIHFPFAGLDEFVIMPDHIHAIIIINELQKNPNMIGQNGDSIISSCTHDITVMGIVDPLHATDLPKPSINIINGDKNPYTNFSGGTKNMHMSSISPSSGSLASIIRSFKSAVAKTIHKTDQDFRWQKSFYDHIIRTNIEMSRIRNYIKNNPSKWNK